VLNSGRRVNGTAEKLDTLRNRSIMLKLLYDNLWYTQRLGCSVLGQLVLDASELTER
jgi:hypothetical protein